MKKLFTLSLALIALFAFAISTSAGENCSGTTAKKTDAKSSTCSASKTTATQASSSACTASKTNATQASAKSACSEEQMAACAKALGMSKEDCAKMCADGSHTIKTISIEGMTCTGCENSVKTALQKVEGVKNVVSISHKDKTAVVCFDPKKCEPATLTKTITSKGYKAQIMPAVAKVSSTDAPSAATCSDAQKKACGSSCTAKKVEAKTDKTAGTK